MQRTVGRSADDGEMLFLRLLAQSQVAFAAYTRAENALESGVLSPAQREQIALAVAEINGSNHCLATHEISAKETGLSDEEIRSAQKASASDPKTEAMLRFVQALVLQRGDVSDEDFSSIRNAGFSGGEIIEVLANVVLNIFTNYFNILAQTEREHLTPPASQRVAPPQNAGSETRP